MMNQKRSDWKLLLVTILLVILYASGAYFSAGNKTVSGLILMLIGILAMLAISIGGFLGSSRVGRHFCFQKADGTELEREDDFLLQTVGFSQSVLFIYLNLVQSNEIVDGLKCLVPIVASVFFFLRGYAKIKDNSRFRYHSIWVLVVVICLTLGSLVIVLAPPILFVGEDVNRYLLTPVCLSIVIAPMGFIKVFCSKRYGYPK